MIEWFDDLKLGMHFKSGDTTVSREDIKRFASEFDPQPFHLDEAAAEKTAFKATSIFAQTGKPVRGLNALTHSERRCDRPDRKACQG
jgi:hypothetical protein